MSAKAKEAGKSAPPSYDQAMAPAYDQAMAPAMVFAPRAPSPVAVGQQPNVVYQYVAPTPIPADEIPDHMVMAIIATVCCCLPLGIVSIVKASDCKAQRAAGNREMALYNSRAAKKWSLWAIGLGIISSICFSILYYMWLVRFQERQRGY